MVDEEKFKNQTELFRRTVLQELDENSLKDPVRIEFLLNQLLKDDEVILSGVAKKNLRTILSGGIKDDNKDNKIDGYKSVSEQYKENLDKILRSRLKTEVQPLGADAMTSMEALGHDVYLDLGLSDVQSKIERFEHKDKLYKCIKDARINAVRNKYLGEDKKTEISGECKWYQFKRKRNIYKAIRDINPVQYWADKETDGSSILKTLGYYKVRKWNSNRPNKRYEKACRRLESIVEDRVKDSELRWFSKDFGRKLGLKAKSLWRNITFRSMDRTLKKLTKNGNVNELRSVIKKYEKKSKDFKADYPENGSSYTKLQRRYINTVDEIVGQIKGKCEEGIKNFNSQFEKAKEDIEKTRSPETEKIIERYKSKLEKVASSINKSALKDFKETSAYKVYEKIKLEDFEKPSITGRDVLEQILINKGINPGSNDFNDVMNRYYPEQVKTTTNDHTQSAEQKQVETPTVENSQSEGQEQNAEGNGIVGAKDIHETLELAEEDNKKIAEALSEEGWLKGNDDGQYKREVDGETQVINFLYNPGNKKYSIDTLDGNDGSRPATIDDYKALAHVMMKNGTTSVTITDLKDQDLENAVTALEEVGVKVENREQVNRRIDEYKEKEKAENATKETEGPTQSGAQKSEETSGGVIEGETQKTEDSSPGNAKEETKGTEDSAPGSAKEETKETEVSAPVSAKEETKNTETSASVNEERKFKSIEDVRASVYKDSTLTEEQKAQRLSIIQNIDRGNYVSYKDIDGAFGKDTEEWGYLRNIAAANDREGWIDREEDIEVFEKLKEEAGIKGQTNIDARFGEVRNVVHLFEDNEVTKENKSAYAAYEALSKDEQFYVSSLCKARSEAKKAGQSENEAETMVFTKLYNGALMRKTPENKNNNGKTRTNDVAKRKYTKKEVTNRNTRNERG